MLKSETILIEIENLNATQIFELAEFFVKYSAKNLPDNYAEYDLEEVKLVYDSLQKLCVNPTLNIEKIYQCLHQLNVIEEENNEDYPFDDSDSFLITFLEQIDYFLSIISAKFSPSDDNKATIINEIKSMFDNYLYDLVNKQIDIVGHDDSDGVVIRQGLKELQKYLNNLNKV